MIEYAALVEQCAPRLDQSLALRLIRRESAFNPYAIGMDGKDVLNPQPKNFEEAVKTAEELIAAGKKFSAGLFQIHISNIRAYRLTWKQVFHACTNVFYGEQIFVDFHNKALKSGYAGPAAVCATLRGYNSGSLTALVSANYAAAISPGCSVLGQAKQQAVSSPAIPEPQVEQSKDFFE